MAQRKQSARGPARVVTDADPSAPILDFLIVADRAEAVNGKLYMMGGAWDRLFVQDFQQPVSFSIALSVVVPWTATNREHRVTINLQTEDGQSIEPTIAVAVNVGRPPTAEAGQSFRAIIVANAAFKLPGPGAYVLSASLAGSPSQRTVFYAISLSNVPPVQILG